MSTSMSTLTLTEMQIQTIGSDLQIQNANGDPDVDTGAKCKGSIILKQKRIFSLIFVAFAVI